jgi:2-dehydro-3-deoxyphosphooctonate aldolase (KDO 8-P synthase)
MPRLCHAGSVTIGPGQPLAVIAGPCVLESRELGFTVARVLAPLCRELGLGFVFKASFDKANRSSINSARGPGLERGLQWLGEIRQETGVPVTTDIHDSRQAEPAAKAVDLIQVPAFLCRQTDLLIAAGESAAHHGRAVNVKKGQFISPQEMAGPVRKLSEAGCDNLLLTERGTTFGYGRLVNDFIGFGDLMNLGPVCFDCTHSTQTPGTGEQTGGRPDRAPLLARAATAAGAHALFIECHPEPARALSDASTMLSLDSVPALLRQVSAIRAALGATA